MIFDVIIIGAGAAGLMAGISAGQRGKSVAVLESNARPGLKILISGGGRCNFTNLNISANDYVSSNPHFCKSALSQFTQHDFISWVEKERIDYYEKTLGQLFCKKSSVQILDLLLDRLQQNKGLLRTSVKIISVTKMENDFEIKTTKETLSARNLIIATGGLSFPKLGASDFGYRIAKQFGHSITSLNPALDGFVFKQETRKIFENLSGISAEVNFSIRNKRFREPVLFTHVGLSGPAALKGSLYWEKNDEISLDFLPDLDDLEKRLNESRNIHGKKSVSTFLATLLPERLAQAIANFTKCQEVTLANLNKSLRVQLIHALKDFKFIPEKTVGYGKAEVTRGGIDTQDISSQTMESKLVPHLFFVGEVVDVTGLLGGYNFQWAWSSGWVAGQNV